MITVYLNDENFFSGECSGYAVVDQLSILYPSLCSCCLQYTNLLHILWPEGKNGKEQDFWQFAYIFKENTTSIDLEFIVCFHLMVV